MKETDYLYMNSGKIIDPSNIQESDLDLRDIFTGLSRIMRFNGQSDCSVLRHSIAVASYFANDDKDTYHWALLHDAAEAYTMDVPTALKRMVGAVWSDMYLMVECAILRRYLPNLSKESIARVSEVDKAVVAYEMDWCLGQSEYPDTLQRSSLAEARDISRRYLWGVKDHDLADVAIYLYGGFDNE